MRRRELSKWARIPTGLLAAMVFLAVAMSCDDIIDNGANYAYQVPQQTGDGWETASLGDAGMDTAPFIELMNHLLSRNDHHVHGILVARNGKLVFEEYFSGEDLDLSNLSDGIAFIHKEFDRATLHCLGSDSKTVTSVLLGIAIDQGLITGTTETMFSFFPDYANLSDAIKSQITLAHMLAMASGLPWNEDYPFDDLRNDLTAMVFSEDPIAYVLSKLAVAEPGEQFIYNSGTTNLLGEVVRRASDVTLWDFAEQHLFAPLGTSSYEWYAFPHASEMAVASSTLYLRPRDMAKIGQKNLNAGLWNGGLVVSEDWVIGSTTMVIDVPAVGVASSSL
jgi:CubicO group peptidase (beta-lactamase class C family)